MVAGNIKQKIKSMTDEDLDAKTIQMLMEASDALRKLQGENDRLRKLLKEYGRHKNRCEWQHHGTCDCGLDAVLKEPDSE